MFVTAVRLSSTVKKNCDKIRNKNNKIQNNTIKYQKKIHKIH